MSLGTIGPFNLRALSPRLLDLPAFSVALALLCLLALFRLSLGGLSDHLLRGLRPLAYLLLWMTRGSRLLALLARFEILPLPALPVRSFALLQ